LMDLRLSREAVAGLKSYDARVPEADLYMAANESPYTLPGAVLAELESGMRDFAFRKYPDPTATRLRGLIAAQQGVEPECVLLGNGGDELLFDLVLAWGGPGRTMLNFPPTFSMYEVYGSLLETKLLSVARDRQTFELDEAGAIEALASGNVDICFVANPNNPSGTMTDPDFLLKMLEASDAIIVVDEAYFDFSGKTVVGYLEKYPNLVILRTFSKAFSLAGLRLGYVMAHPEVIATLEKVRMPYSVNAFTQWVGELTVTYQDSFASSIESIKTERDRLFKSLEELREVTVWPSGANYLLFRLPNAHLVWQRLLDEHRIYIRDFSRAPGLDDCLRVTVGTPEQNQTFLRALRESIVMAPIAGGLCGFS